jgi:integrase/recombinase XerD
VFDLSIECVEMAKSTHSRKEIDRIKYIDSSHIETLFKQIAQKRDRALFRLGYHRGLRASEVRLLQLDDLDRSGRDWTLFVHRLKGGKSGRFALSAVEQSSLRAYLRERGEGLGPLILSRKRGAAPSQQQLDRLMKRYCAAAGIAGDLAHWHTLRHSCATHLLEMGCKAEYVQEHLGHRDIKNTLIYMRVSEKLKAQTFEQRLRGWR